MATRRRAPRGGFGLMLLAGQIMQIGPSRIPPVTLITAAINVIIYMRLIPNIPSVRNACTSNHYVINQKQWPRLVYSSFYHLDDMHLYFNMVSFIWKGLKLERKMKSLKFFIVIVTFSILTQVTMLIVNKFFAEALSNDYYLITCAAGFSAVIFALKVLTSSSGDDGVNVMGLQLPIPSRYGCWVELILIHILVPNSSFTGHLSGIIVGLLYTYGPLRYFVKAVKKAIQLLGSSSTNPGQQHSYYPPPQHSYYQQPATAQADSDENVAIQRAIQESLRNTNFQGGNGGMRNHPPSYGWNVADNTATDNTATHQQERLYPTLPTNNYQQPNSPSAPPHSDHGGGYNNAHSLPYPPATNTPPYSNYGGDYDNKATHSLPYPPSDNTPSYGDHGVGYNKATTNCLPYPSGPTSPHTSNYGYPPPSVDTGASPVSEHDFSNEQEFNGSPDEQMRAARLRRFDKKSN